MLKNEAKEVEQGFRKARDELSALSNCRWQTGRDATEIERPIEGHNISGG